MEWTREHRLFPAQMERVIDGDTFWFLVDTGIHQRAEWPFRLLGYDAWEKSQPLGPAATAFAEAWFTEHALHSTHRFPFILHTTPESKTNIFERTTLGRFLAEVICDQGHSYGPMLFAEGLTKTPPQ